MDRLILLIGASGSGKTSVAKELEKEGYNIIQSYTTREKRRTEEWGHIFADITDIRNTPSDNIIAFQEVYEGVYYWATKEQYEGYGDSVYIVCPDGAKNVKDRLKYDDVEILTIYLQSDKNVRWKRMMYDRDKQQLDARLEADRDKFQIVEADYTIDGNLDLDIVVDNIYKTLRKDDKDV